MDGDHPPKRRRASAGWEFAASAILVIVMALMLFAAATSYFIRPNVQRSTCVNNLRQMGLVIALYANENADRFPPLDDRPGNLMFAGSLVFPEFLTNVDVLGCPSDPGFDPNTSFRLAQARSPHHAGLTPGEPHADCLNSQSYQYLGYTVADDADLAALAHVWTAQEKNLRPPDAVWNASSNAWEDVEDLSLTPEQRTILGEELIETFTGGAVARSSSGQLIRPLRNGRTYCFLPVEFYEALEVLGENADAPSAGSVPVAWDAEWNHQQSGGGKQVLYLDGHVEMHPLNPNEARFPLSPYSHAWLNSHVPAKSGNPNDPWGDCP